MASRLDFSQIRSLYVGTSSGTTVDTNNVVVVGNIGVGTTSPVAKLHIQAGNPRILLQDSSTGYPYIQANNSSGNFYFSIDNAAGTGFGSAYGRYIYSDGAYPVIFVTQDAERMRIVAAGNVGIGTTAPLAILSVGSGSLADGNLPIQISTAGGVTERYIGINKNGGYGLIVGYNESAAALSGVGAYIRQVTADPLHFVVNNSTTAMTILSGGNVGIGTTSPKQKLIVEGTLATKPAGVDGYYSYLRSNWAQDNAFELGISEDGANTFHKLITSSDYYFGTTLQFWTSDTEKMRITGAGNVGIGTTSPNAQLDAFTTQGGSTIAATHGTGGTYPKASGISFGATSTSLSVSNNGGTVVFTGGAGIYANNTASSNNPTELVFWTTSGGTPAARLTIASTGAATFSSSVTASSLIKSGGTASQYLMADGSTSTTSNVAPRYVATVNVSQTAYTQICTIVGGSLASAVNMSFQGTSGNVVVNVTAQILVNHFQDITITTTSGFYSQLNIRVISNNNETYSVEAQVVSAQGQTTDLNIEVFPLNSESVTFGGSPVTPGTTLVHTTRQGLYISASEGISISSGNDIYAAGNVGIGTTAPARTLNVSSNGTAGTQVQINGTQDSAGIKFVPASGDSWEVQASTSNQWFVYNRTDESYRLLIDGSGNVGIGTTSPGSFSGTTFASPILDLVGSLNIRGLSSDTVSIINMGGATYRKASIFTPIGNDDPYLALAVSTGGTTSSGAERMRITSSGQVLINSTSMDGKLGINTATSVSYNPNAYNGTYANIRLTNGSAGVSRYTGIAFGGGGSTEAFIGSVQNANEWAEIVFQTYNGSAYGERARITSAGNVGIGTTAPVSALSVVGKTNLGNQASGFYVTPSTLHIASSTVSQISFEDYVVTAAIAIAGDTFAFGHQNASPSYEFKYSNTYNGNYATTGTTFARFNPTTSYISAGNVGIGTTNPTYKLTVSTSGALGFSLVTGTATVGNPQIDIYDAGRAQETVISSTDGTTVGTYIASYTNHPLLFGTNAGSSPIAKMVVTSAGNVGIGTSAPDTPLSSARGIVINSGASNDVQIRMQNNTTGSAGSDGGLLSISGSQMYLWNYEASNLIFGTNNTERMRIDSSGNVGIGTTAPTEKVDIRGVVRVSRDGVNDSGILAFGNYANGIGYYDNGIFRSALNNISSSGNTLHMGSYEALAFTTSQNALGSQTIRMYIPASTGNVGIGTTSPSSLLHVAGDARITSGSLGVGVAPNATDGRIDASNDIVAYSTSDQRLKENVTPIENALEKVKTLTGVEFDWKEETAHVHGYHGHDVGIIAQDVQAVLPEAVRTNDSGYLSVRYEKMIALLIEANKELAARVEELEKKLK